MTGLVRLHGIVALTALVSALGASCGEEEGDSSSIGNTAISTPAAAAVKTGQAVDEAAGRPPPPAAETMPAASSGTATQEQGRQRTEITPDLFIPSDDNRDPFQKFETGATEVAEGPGTTDVGPTAAPPPIENVLFPDYDIDDLSCSMILAMAGEKPRAYLRAPNGDSGYVTQGGYVGRPFYARTPGRGSGTAEVYWRVYEVMEGGVSFEASIAASPDETGPREVRRIYTEDEMERFADLFTLR